MKLDLHKDFYFFEWSRKDQLTNNAGLPIAILTVLIGGVFFLCSNFPYRQDWLTYCFIVLAAVVSVAIATSIVFRNRALQGKWYEQIPSPKDLNQYYAELTTYFKRTGRPVEDVEQEFQQFLRERMAEATTRNRENYAATATSLYHAMTAIIAATVFAGLTATLYIVGKRIDLQNVECQTKSNLSRRNRISLSSNSRNKNRLPNRLSSRRMN